METSNYQLPKITQEQKDAILIYKTIMQQNDTDLFTAYKFYQWFVKRAEFLVRRDENYKSELLDGRFTPEYIHCRLIDLLLLNLCKINVGLPGINQDVILTGVRLKENGDLYGIPNPVYPLYPYTYIKTLNWETLSNISHMNGMYALCFMFNNKNAKTQIKIVDEFTEDDNYKPVIIVLKNKSSEIQRIKLFKNQLIPSEVEVSAKLPNISFQDISDEIKYGNHVCNKICLRETGYNRDGIASEAYFLAIKKSDISGAISNIIIRAAADDFENGKTLYSQKQFPLNHKTTLDFDIKPKDELSLFLYLTEQK